MKNYISNINFWDLEAQKYWNAPQSWSSERKESFVKEAIYSNEYIGSRKMDGAWYKFLKDEDGGMTLSGRSKGVDGVYIDKIGHVPQLRSFFEALPNGTCIIGEIYFPNREGSSNVTTIMGCLEQKAIERQEAGDKLHYYIFDILAWDHEIYYTKNIEDRVDKINRERNNYKFDFIEWATYWKGQDAWNNLQDILCSGGEGIVLTKCGTCYQPGKRPAKQTIKVKKELQESIDAVIIGAIEPTKYYTGKELEVWPYWEQSRTGEKVEGLYYRNYRLGEPYDPVTKTYWHGWAGSLRIGAMKDGRMTEIGAISGLTEEILQNWQKYLGCVIEVGAMEIMQDTKGIRHPRFIGFRPDLRPEDTDYYRIFR